MVDPASVSYVLSSFASVGKLLETLMKIREVGIMPTSEQFSHMKENADASGDKLREDRGTSIALSVALSQPVLDALRDELDRIRGAISDTYRDPGLSGYDKDRQADICRRDYCHTLHRMKKHLGGTLPKELQDEWDLNICKTFTFII